jgi:hypothetical protein
MTSPALPFRVARVHAEQGPGKQSRLVASGAGPDLQKDVALVVGIPGKKLRLDFAHEAGLPLLQGLQFRLGKLAHFRVRKHLASVGGGLFCITIGAVQVHDGDQFRVLAREPTVNVEVPGHILRRERAAEFLEPPGDVGELRGERRLH